MVRRLRTLWLLILKETQTIVTLATALSILHLRNLHSVYIGAGATVAAVVAKVLKRCIRQPRPSLSHKTTYGMPSTHSSSIAFFGTYLSLCIARLKPHPRFLPHLLSRRGDTEDFSLPIRVFLAGGVLYGAGSVCWSRVRLTYHTPAQVLAGVAVGSSLAVLSFVVWQQHVAQFAPLVEGIVEELLLVALDSWQLGSMTPLRDSLFALWREWAPPLTKAAAGAAQPSRIVELR